MWWWWHGAYGSDSEDGEAKASPKRAKHEVIHLDLVEDSKAPDIVVEELTPRWLESPKVSVKSEQVEKAKRRLPSSEEQEAAARAAARLKQRRVASTWTVDPLGSNSAKFIECSLVVALAYTAVMTPVEVTFLPPSDSPTVFALNQVVNVVFVADMILQFFLHYEEPQTHEWVRNGRAIAENYLRGYFVVDLASSFPFELFGLFVRSPVVNRISSLRLLRLMRLVKLLRMAGSLRIVSRYRADLETSFAYLNLLGYVLTMVLVAHWYACVWGFAANLSRPRNSWHAPFRGQDYAWSIDSAKNQYLMALYFSVMTLTTVGFGDVNPQNLSEYAVATFGMFAGGFLWAYVIGSVCGTVATMDRVKIRYQQRYDQINGMLLEAGVSKMLARHVRSYLLHTESVARHVEYPALVEHLSPGLQRALCNELSQATVDTAHYFRNRTAAFRLAVFKKFHTALFCPDEAVETDDLVVVYNNGIIKAVEPNGLLKLYVRGMALNLDFVLRNAALRLKCATKAVTFVECHTLSHWALDEVCEAFPQEKYMMLWMRVMYALRNRVRTARANGEPPVASARLLTSDEAAPVDDLGAALDVVTRHRRLDCLSDDLKDCTRLVHLAIAKDATNFVHASPRLRADPATVLRAIAACPPDRHWKLAILPHIPSPLRKLLETVAVDDQRTHRHRSLASHHHEDDDDRPLISWGTHATFYAGKSPTKTEVLEIGSAPPSPC